MYSRLTNSGRTVATWIVLILIGLYRAVGSLWLSGSCRFEPSCSVYAQEAIENFGVLAGGKLAFTRLLACRPGGRFGYDPVPSEHQAGKTMLVRKESE